MGDVDESEVSLARATPGDEGETRGHARSRRTVRRRRGRGVNVTSLLVPDMNIYNDYAMAESNQCNVPDAKPLKCTGQSIAQYIAVLIHQFMSNESVPFNQVVINQYVSINP